MSTDIGGRPRKIKSPEEFDALVDEYVGECMLEKKPITVTGITLALGFSDKTSFYDYGNYEGFSHCVKRARTIIEHGYELGLHASAPAGSIFALKNMGWKDIQQIDQTVRKAAGDMDDEELEAIASGGRTGTSKEKKGEEKLH